MQDGMIEAEKHEKACFVVVLDSVDTVTRGMQRLGREYTKEDIAAYAQYLRRQSDALEKISSHLG
jgi:hypothetical protein